MPETWEDSAGATTSLTALLRPVLKYDDLLAEQDPTVLWLEGEGEVCIGRAEGKQTLGFRSRNAIAIPDRWVSTRHATIVCAPSDGAGPKHLLVDLASRNGTHLNGEPVKGRPRLLDGDVVEIGHTLFCYRVVAVAERAALEAPADRRRLGPTETRSPEVVKLVRDLSIISTSEVPILELAETGAGKEVVARMVHELSGRVGPFVAVDCGAVPDGLFEATLFGHKRGAFTGANEHRVGEIARADGGTLFLDEVANMSATSQAKLLRVIEEGVVTPIGASEPRKVDVRWIAATNSPTIAEPDAFRPDLLRRLSGYVARIPPLRKRRDDLGVLCAHVLAEAGIERAAMAPAAARKFFSGTFPGNVRQLRNMLRSAALLAQGRAIDVVELSAADATWSQESSGDTFDDTSSAPAPAAPARRRGLVDAASLQAALASSGGNVLAAARALDAHPKQMYRWIEKHGLDLERFRR